MLPWLLLAASAGGGGIVSLVNIELFATDASVPKESSNEVRWDHSSNFGEIWVDEYNNDAGAVYRFHQEWISPTGFASDQYEIMYDTFSDGDDFTAAASASGAWIALGAARSYRYTYTGSSTRTRTCVFHIRPVGGSEIDSLIFTMNHDNSGA